MAKHPNATFDAHKLDKAFKRHKKLIKGIDGSQK
jgi:hypothetical protein